MGIVEIGLCVVLIGLALFGGRYWGIDIGEKRERERVRAREVAALEAAQRDEEDVRIASSATEVVSQEVGRLADLGDGDYLTCAPATKVEDSENWLNYLEFPDKIRRSVLLRERAPRGGFFIRKKQVHPVSLPREQHLEPDPRVAESIRLPGGRGRDTPAAPSVEKPSPQAQAGR